MPGYEGMIEREETSGFHFDSFIDYGKLCC